MTKAKREWEIDDHDKFSIDFSAPDWKVLEINDSGMKRKGLMVGDIIRKVDGLDVNENLAECKLKMEEKQNLTITMEVIQIYASSVNHFSLSRSSLMWM